MAAISSFNPIDIYNYRKPQNQGDITARKQGASAQLDNKAPGSNRSISIAMESYKSESLYMEYTSKDGDKAVLSYQNVEYQKTQMQITAGAGTSDEDWKKIVDKVMEEYKTMRGELIKGMLGTTDDQNDGGTGAVHTTSAEVQAAPVPEYWNAENTSQRIFDFATQFLDAFKGSGEEFYNKIRDAIKQGFEMAHKELGSLPDSVNKLVSDTFELTMKKLDAWALGKGIRTDNEQSETALAAAQNESLNAVTGAL